MVDPKELDIEIARLEYGESSYPAYAKLADLYIIRDQLERGKELPAYSSAPAPQMVERIERYGDSDFLRAVDGLYPADVWPIMDDLMDTLHSVAPRVYNSVMRRIDAL